MNRKRARIIVSGVVQGVGFRPFVYRLAKELQLTGYVSNSSQGVLIEVEGAENELFKFLDRLESDKPPLAAIQDVNHCFFEPVEYEHFEIHETETHGAKTALILPDITTCPDCLREILDPRDRRYLYPFTNCTNCGPRFSIIEALPYDRTNTSMKQFAMCPECEREYHDPNDRRFHAQPNACPSCGPRLELWDTEGQCLLTGHDTLLNAAEAVRHGQIVAVKGIGGFQLLTDARNEDAIQQLRARKHRKEKPLALMLPSVDAIENICQVAEPEKHLLLSPAAPIVLLRKKDGELQPAFSIAPSVAPQNPYLGVMLPFSPLHHLLLSSLDFPVVATSGNLTDEPICTDEHEAVERLRGIADIFLVHNRPIVRHMDDSVTRIMAGREMVLRRARGYAPLPIKLETPNSKPETVLALGAHLKNAVALGIGSQAFTSQHIGDLETAQAYAAFRKSAADLPRLYEASPAIIAHDLHPEYLSTKFAAQLELGSAPALGRSETRPRGSHGRSNATNDSVTSHAAEFGAGARRTAAEGGCAPQSSDREAGDKAHIFGVQHHYAHVLSCMADNQLASPALGISWDGTGFGTDETIWGGEFLLINKTSFERFAHFREFRLPGGDAAIKQPRRSALGLLHEIFGADVFNQTDIIPIQHFFQSELRMFKRMLAAGVNSPRTSSAGRLFDAVASLIGLRQRASFEGQGAMELEFVSASGIDDAYPIELRKTTPLIFDWQPMILEILKDLRQNRTTGVIAAKFHNTLVEVIVAVARTAGESNVVLSGGCFQNQYLTERAIRRLREEHFTPYWHHQIPPNDGGIALGQIVAAMRMRTELGSKPDGRERQIDSQWVEMLSKP
jgi:hydrogenase maturation protein HypF